MDSLQNNIEKLTAQNNSIWKRGCSQSRLLFQGKLELCLRNLNSYFCPVDLGIFKRGDVSCV